MLEAYDDDDSGLMEIDEFARLCRRLGHVERQLGFSSDSEGYSDGWTRAGQRGDAAAAYGRDTPDAVARIFARFDRNGSGRCVGSWA